MQNNTPEERDRQEKALSQMFPSPEHVAKATVILEQAKSPREKELATTLLKNISEKFAAQPEERGCQIPTGKKELSSSAQFYADGQKERIAARIALVEKAQEGLTTSDLKAIIAEVGGTLKTFPPNFSSGIPIEQTKNLVETKKLIETFKEKIATYPKYLTYEGSVVLCVMLSINESESISLNGLPLVDRELILSQLPSDALKKLQEFNSHIKIEFDDTRDFVITYIAEGKPPLPFKFFNTVIHSQNRPETNVPIEKDGEKVMVGNTLVLDKKRIQKLVGAPLHPSVGNDTIQTEDVYSRRQPVAGRNAFEIREDILECAVTVLLHNNRDNKISPEEVVATARVLYTFVEDRNRR